MEYTKINFSKNRDNVQKMVSEIREVIVRFRKNLIQYEEAINDIYKIKEQYSDPVLSMAMFHISFLERVIEDGLDIDYDKILF